MMPFVYFVLTLCLVITLHKNINFYVELAGSSPKSEETKSVDSSSSIPIIVSVDKAIFIPVIQKIVVLAIPFHDQPLFNRFQIKDIYSYLE